jgi:hypothetical protein
MFVKQRQQRAAVDQHDLDAGFAPKVIRLFNLGVLIGRNRRIRLRKARVAFLGNHCEYVLKRGIGRSRPRHFLRRYLIPHLRRMCLAVARQIRDGSDLVILAPKQISA